jgi:hypothetical protein
VNRAVLLWLGALVLAMVFLALDPLLTFPIFGSDTGEYFRLTAGLAASGHLPLSNYPGWGFAYPDFPGILIVAAATSQSVGVDPLTALLTTIPVLAVASVVPLFLIFRRLHPNETVALLGAGFATVAMPRLFSLAHPAPLALGDLFVVASLWMFLEGRRDARWYGALVITAAALIVTHHLSSYFFAVSALGGLFLFELARPGRWSARFPMRELVFLAAFLVAVVGYWFVYAQEFRSVLVEGLGSVSGALAVGAGAGAVLAVATVGGLAAHRRRTAPPNPERLTRLPTDRAVARDFFLILAGVGIGSAALILVALPGSAQTASPWTVIYFLPLTLTIALAAGSRRVLFFERLGPFTLTWLGALSLAAFAALASSNAVLPPSRHAEYLLIPLGLLTAIGIGRLVARWGDRAGRRAIVAGSAAAVLLLAANAAIAYPPPAQLAGFQEGLTDGDAALWMWVGIGVPPTATVASDHRLSSMVFGFDGNNATWQSTPSLFLGDNWSRAAAELSGSVAPRGALQPIDVVALDGVMVQGVALDPGGLALPMSPQAVAWFSEPPFVLLYENGSEKVYWVDGPVTS